MSGVFWRALSTGLSVVLLAGCSPAPEQSSSDYSRLLQLPLTFGWEAPARLNVRETTKIEGKIFRIKYDLMIEAYDELEDHLLLSFENVTPIEFEGDQINMSTYPTEIRQKVRLVLADYYTRPSFIVTPKGQIAGFANVEKSIRTLVEITQDTDAESQQRVYESFVTDQRMRTQLESNSDAIWSCLARPWLDFNTPVNESSEQAVSLAIVEGAGAVPATRTNTNKGFVRDAESLIELESVTVSSGVELARALQELSRDTADASGELPNIEGVVTAAIWRSAKVKLDPTNLKPQWARCDSEFTIDSKDTSILPSDSRTRMAEFEIQWL